MCFPDDCTYIYLNFEAVRHRTVVYDRVFAFVSAGRETYGVTMQLLILKF